MKRNANFKDLTNRQFGYLTAIRVDEDKTTSKHLYWFCQCVCGKTRSLQTAQLTSNKVTSCGCMNKRKKLASKRFIRTSKGTSSNRMYSVYYAMIARCENPKSVSFKYYGAKGITVCDEWKNSFSAFAEWSLNNGYTDELSIDRIDNSKGYNPSNCRWVTKHDQLLNKTNNLFLTHNGETHTMSEWCEILGFSKDLAKSRSKELRKKNIERTFDLIFCVPKHQRRVSKS